LTRCRQALGLSIKYVESWKPRDAFREFFQNWSVLLFLLFPTTLFARAK
jgi:hypothetical protein